MTLEFQYLKYFKPPWRVLASIIHEMNRRINGVSLWRGSVSAM